jgi:hypothetical protein
MVRHEYVTLYDHIGKIDILVALSNENHESVKPD